VSEVHLIDVAHYSPFVNNVPDHRGFNGGFEQQSHRLNPGITVKTGEKGAETQVKPVGRSTFWQEEHKSGNITPGQEYHPREQDYQL